MNVRVYLAQAMSYVSQNKIYQKNYYCTKVLMKHGITVLSPVTEENIKPSKKKFDQPSQEQLAFYWRRDKWLIKQSHILLDIAGPVVSQGVLHELGLTRYFYFKPVLRVLKLKGPSVAIEEEDQIFSTVESAAKFIVKELGTPWLRLRWKFKLFGRCFPGYIKTRILWWFDWL